MKAWQLQNVDNTEYIPDTSGVYVLIYWQNKTNTARLDIISNNHEPIQSFAGTANNVRKHAIRFLSDNGYNVSLEHASYIGLELEKADNMRIDYVQDAEKPNARPIEIVL